ncbi:aldo-keto reductase-like protein [Decorospora gaudefroyi]|uniref:Aldo-keto reductase-like protein n=1 Tax=Decorospora gaudefroyi TaxID=184978 RepID=A0A6A5K471_9PLEO|nr:aldo-keto reductase-like protein [Decorospora gaudefroyi]
MASTSTNQRVSRLYDDEPAFIYGTAWKKDRTKELVKEALKQGFRRVDTAAQPRHYQEGLVGEALREAFTEGVLKRDELYLQTKYTTPAGQDLSNMPYDPKAPLETQVRSSVASSLKNLRHEAESEGTAYIDCLLLHSPLPTIEQTLQAWKLLESYVPGQIRALGISNVTLPVLQAIYEHAAVKPAVVQNRFHHQTRYDVALRAFCIERNITYQSFWTLTGNPTLLKSGPVTALAQAANVDFPVALYALVMDLGVVVLNGSTSRHHLRTDLEGIQSVREWAKSHAEDFASINEGFGSLVGQDNTT